MYTNQQFIAQSASLQHGTRVTMMSKVEATINPDAIFTNCDVLLRVYRPAAWSRDILVMVSLDRFRGG